MAPDPIFLKWSPLAGRVVFSESQRGKESREEKIGMARARRRVTLARLTAGLTCRASRRWARGVSCLVWFVAALAPGKAPRRPRSGAIPLGRGSEVRACRRRMGRYSSITSRRSLPIATPLRFKTGLRCGTARRLLAGSRRTPPIRRRGVRRCWRSDFWAASSTATPCWARRPRPRRGRAHHG